MVAENPEVENDHVVGSTFSIEGPEQIPTITHEKPVWFEAALSTGAIVHRSPRGDFILTPDKSRLESKRSTLIEGGIDSLQIISDFDFTLTSFDVNGKQGSSCHGCLETCGLLTEEYHRIVQALKAKYYPLEVDPTLRNDQRAKLMEEWVSQAHQALSTSGLTRQKISQAVSLANIALRTGHDEFFNEIGTRSIPFLIFSAGLADVLEEVLEQHALAPLPSKTHIISNRMVFDDDEFAGFVGPLLHVCNKMASTVLSEPYFENHEIKDRKHVLLLGDSLGDLSMSSGLEVKEVLSIGFLNDNIESRLDGYLAGFDVVVIGPNAGLHYALDIITEMS